MSSNKRIEKYMALEKALIEKAAEINGAPIVSTHDFWALVFGEPDHTVVKVGRWGEQFIKSPRLQILERYHELKKLTAKGSIEAQRLHLAFDFAMRELRC